MRLLIFFLLCFAGAGLSAQSGPNPTEPVLAYRNSEKTYNLTEFKQKRERTLLGDLDLTGFWGGPTYNYSMSGDDWALVRGGFGGMEFGDEFFIGYGGWKSREDFNINNPGENTGYKFRQGGVILAYSPNRDNSIHPRFSAIIGPGSIDPLNDTTDELDRMLIGQAMAGLELNLFQIMRLGIDGGYRFANGVDTDGITDKDVSGPVIQIEARFGFSW